MNFIYNFSLIGESTITVYTVPNTKKQPLLTHLTTEQEEPAMTEFINVLLIGYTVLQAVMYIALAIREDREAKEHRKDVKHDSVHKHVQFQSI